MKSTRVVNIRKEPFDIYIGRAGKGYDGYFGNPFPTKNEFKWHFLERIESDPEFKRRVEGMKGMRLGCFCDPKPCHGDVYVEYLERPDESQLKLFENAN